MSEAAIPAPPLGDNLRDELARTGLTTTEAAFKLGVSERQVRRWMSGESIPTWQSLTAWSELFGRAQAWFYAEHETEVDAA